MREIWLTCSDSTAQFKFNSSLGECNLLHNIKLISVAVTNRKIIVQ
jgi:hypothetical protein